MKSILILSVLSLCPKPAVADDQAALQGLWQAEKLIGNGKAAPPGVVQRFQVLVKGNRITFNPQRKKWSSNFELNEKAIPKTMDLTPNGGPGKGRKMKVAIYQLKGNTLIICMDKEDASGKRPREFKTVPGDGLALLTLKRVKKESKP